MKAGTDGRYVQYLLYHGPCVYCGKDAELVELVDSWNKKVLDRGCVDCVERGIAHFGV